MNLKYVPLTDTLYNYICSSRSHSADPLLDALRECGWDHHFDVYAYCCLPDELILIVRGKEETSDMRTFLRDFRSRSSSLLEPGIGHTLWSRKFLERVLRRDEDSKVVAGAVFQRPVSAGLAAKSEDYPYVGSFVKVARDSDARKFRKRAKMGIRIQPRKKGRRRTSSR